MVLNINQLPPELLAKIFQSVEDLTERIQLERVCRRWQKISRANCWRAVEQCIFPLEQFNNCLKLVPLIADRCGNSLMELRLKNLVVNEKLAKTICNSISHLKHLDFNGCALEEQAIYAIMNTFGSELYTLMFLDILAYQYRAKGSVLNNALKLEHLGLNFDHNYSKGILPDTLPPQLKSLYLMSWAEFECDVFRIVTEAGRKCPALKCLYLDLDANCAELLPIVGRMKGLVFLRLPYYLPSLHEPIKQCLSNLSNLKALNLKYCQPLLEDIVKHCPQLIHLRLSYLQFELIDFTPLLKLTSLRSLVLRIPSHKGANCASMRFPATLQHLDIQGITLPPTVLVQNIIQQCPDLSSLHLTTYQLLLVGGPNEFEQFHAAIAPLFGQPAINNTISSRSSIAVHFQYTNQRAKFVLPRDLDFLPRALELGPGVWQPRNGSSKVANNENPVLAQFLVDEAVLGQNSPSFLMDYWMADEY